MMAANKYALELVPATIPISIAGGDVVHVDPYEANDRIAECAGPDGWEKVRSLVAEYLGVDPSVLRWNQVYDFGEMIPAVCAELTAERKKKVSEIAS